MVCKKGINFDEECWNSYPTVKTKVSQNYFKNFRVTMESNHLRDFGQSENVFNLNKSDLEIRNISKLCIILAEFVEKFRTN